MAIFVAVLFLTLNVFTSIANSPNAYAATGQELTLPCGLSVNSGSIAWTADCMSLKFKNRAVVTLSLKDGATDFIKNTTNNTKLSIWAGDYIKNESNKSEYVNPKTGSTLFMGAPLSGSGELDERLKSRSSSELSDALKGAKLYLFAHATDAFGTNVCQNIGTDNYVGLNIENGSNAAWTCRDDPIPLNGQEGAADQIMFLDNNLAGDLNDSNKNLTNANITYFSSADGRTLTSVFPGNQANDSFKYCPSERKYALKDCANPTDGYTINNVPDYFKGSGAVTVVAESSSKPTIQLRIAQSENTAAQTQTGGTDTDGSGAIVDDCDGIVPGGIVSKFNPVTWASNAFDWFGCTVAKGFVSTTEFLANTIGSMLITNRNEAQDDVLKEITRRFLTIANILFVIAFLIMVLSTALNLGVVDAYTVKKLLPRIFIAAVLANLSFVIVDVLISITNELGVFIREVIISPLSRVDPELGADTGAALFTLLATSIWGLVAAVTTGSIFVLIPAALTALMSIVVAFIVVIIRRIIILLLIVVAPVAIAMWVIPGMDNWAKKWWKLFVQMLMVYPIIMAFLAAGQLTAGLILTGKQGELDPLEAITALAAMVIPLFLLPTVFKLASSTIGNLTGMINNKGKGLFDRGSNWARERAKNTDRRQTREAEKEAKQSARRQRNSAAGIERAIHPSGIRGWARRRGLTDRQLEADDITLLQAQEAKQRLRIPQAQEETRSATVRAGQLRLDNAHINDSRSTFHYIADDGTLQRLDGKREALVALTNGGRVRVTDAAGHAADLGTDPATLEADMRAAAHTLAGQGDVQGLRNALDTATPEQHQIITDAMQANVGSVMPKAPDLIKPPAAAFGAVTASGMVDWDPSTSEEALDYLNSLEPGEARNQAWSRFRSSLDTLLNDPKLHGAQSANTRQSLRNHLRELAQTPGAQLDVVSLYDRLTNHDDETRPIINDDGTVRPPESQTTT